MKTIQDLYTYLGDFRAKQFGEKTEKHYPFRTRFLYKNNYWIFDKYVNSEGNFKLDVCFNLDGSANIVLWNTDKRNDEGYQIVKQLLIEIDLIDKFTSERKYNGLHCHLEISSKYPKMENVDAETLIIVKEIFERLGKLTR